MSELGTNGLSPEAVRAIDLATVIARNGGHRTVTPDHLATALLKQSDGLAGSLLRTHFGVDLFELRNRLEAGLRDVRDNLTPGQLTHRFNGEPFDISPELARIVARARDLAVQQRKPVAGTDHLLTALLDEDTRATRAFAASGIAAEQVGEASASIPLPPALARRHGLAFGGPAGAGAPATLTAPGGPGGPGRPGRPTGAGNGRPAGGEGAVYELVGALRAGQLPAVAERTGLLEGLANLLVQPQTSAARRRSRPGGRRSSGA
ncbi:MAG TPA: Clp protease N-terminal domain-containing protein, partial [Chloroflexota bacterium]|nr:Clp protease N-terminal domain-containing protein [Chloroflexota bacterium]